MNLNLAQVCGGKRRQALAVLAMRPVSLPICVRLHFHASFFLCQPFSPPALARLCSFLHVAAPSLYLRSVTGEFPELITGRNPGEQQGPNHLQVEGLQRDRLITFSTAWLKTAHKSLVHVDLAACTCIGTCTLVNAAIVDTTLFHANTAQLNLGSYGNQYSCFPQRNCKLGFLWHACIL